MGIEKSETLSLVMFGVMALCMAVGIVAAMLGTSARRKRAMMRRNKTLTYAELTAGGPAWGLCEVSGTVRPGPDGPLTAPLSGRPCVWYRAVARRKTSEGIQAFLTDVSAAPILLDDGTGPVTVMPADEVTGAVKSLDLDRVPPAEVGALPRAARRVPRAKADADVEWYRYEEWILPPGAELYACGKAVYDGVSVVMDRPYPEDMGSATDAERRIAEDHPYVLSALSERQATRRATRRMVLAYAVAGVAGVLGTAAFVVSAESLPEKPRRR